jgi:transposase-like protein
VRSEQKRSRGYRKNACFGPLKAGGQSFCDGRSQLRQRRTSAIIQGKILEGSTIHPDDWKADAGLALKSDNHNRVFHRQHEFACGKSHVNGSECFWRFAQHRLAKFNGIPSDAFLLHLKESEFRFNNRKNDLAQIILKSFNQIKRC